MGKECCSNVSSRLWGGALRDETKNGCEGDYSCPYFEGFSPGTPVLLGSFHKRQHSNGNSGQKRHSVEAPEIPIYPFISLHNLYFLMELVTHTILYL